MKPALRRRMIWAGAATAVFVVALVLVLPFVASTRLVGERIAEDMRDWSGLDVAIADPPAISVWPDLQANLTGVTLSLPDGGATLTAERVEIELSTLAALGGDIDFSNAKFIRPVLRLKNSGMPALPGNGRLGVAIRTARDVVLENRLAPDRSRLPNDDFGVVEFVDGRIVRTTGDAEDEIASGLSGKLDWETLSGQATLQASGTMRGEPASVAFSTGNAMLLLGGADTQVKLDLKSVPMNFAFNGTASLGESAHAEGRTSFSAPSVRKMLEWSTATGADSPALGAVTLDADMVGDLARVRLENATVTLDGKQSRGSLDLMLSGKRPKLAGSLAFDQLDLAAFLKAFTPLDATSGTGPGTIDADFASRLNLDLRLSAARATMGAAELTDLAATTRVDDGLAAFDISDASIFGGDIQAGLRFDGKGDGIHAEMRVLGTDIDGAAFGAASGLSDVVPQSPGSLSLILKGDGASWESLMASASGSLTASFREGTLPGIDVDGLVTRARGGVAFPLAEVSGASTLGALDVKTTVTAGRAKIDRAEIRTSLHRVSVSGSVGLANGMLALRGTVDAPPDAAMDTTQAPASTTFLVDGPWRSATVNPAAVTNAAD